MQIQHKAYSNRQLFQSIQTGIIQNGSAVSAMWREKIQDKVSDESKKYTYSTTRFLWFCKYDPTLLQDGFDPDQPKLSPEQLTKTEELAQSKRKTRHLFICPPSKSHKSLAIRLSVTEGHICCMETVKTINMIKWKNDKISLNLEVMPWKLKPK